MGLSVPFRSFSCSDSTWFMIYPLSNFRIGRQQPILLEALPYLTQYCDDCSEVLQTMFRTYLVRPIRMPLLHVVKRFASLGGYRHQLGAAVMRVLAKLDEPISRQSIGGLLHTPPG